MEPKSTTAMPAASSPIATPVLDVVAPPPAAKDNKSATDLPKLDNKANTVTKTAKAPHNTNGNIKLAIFASVIIILGLGLLAVVAYLHQVK